MITSLDSVLVYFCFRWLWRRPSLTSVGRTTITGMITNRCLRTISWWYWRTSWCLRPTTLDDRQGPRSYTVYLIQPDSSDSSPLLDVKIIFTFTSYVYFMTLMKTWLLYIYLFIWKTLMKTGQQMKWIYVLYVWNVVWQLLISISVEGDNSYLFVFNGCLVSVNSFLFLHTHLMYWYMFMLQWSLIVL